MSGSNDCVLHPGAPKKVTLVHYASYRCACGYFGWPAGGPTPPGDPCPNCHQALVLDGPSRVIGYFGCGACFPSGVTQALALSWVPLAAPP